MLTSTQLRKTLAFGLTLALCVLLSASDLEAGKKKKKKSKKKKPAPVAQTQEEGASGLAAQPSAVRKADRYLLAYDTGAARKVLEGQDKSDPWVATAIGRALGQEGDYDGAAAELRRAADRDTQNPAPTLFLGDCLAYAGKKGAAADAYAQTEARAHGLLAAKSDDAEALYFLGVAEQRQQRFSDAAQTLARARALRPDDAKIVYRLGVTRFYQEQWQTAFDLLSEALDRNSGIAYAYYYRGLTAGKLNRKDILYNDLDRFVKMAPNAPEASNAKQILSSFG